MTEQIFIYDRNEKMQLILKDLPGNFDKVKITEKENMLTQLAGMYLGVYDDNGYEYEEREGQTTPSVFVPYKNGVITEELNGAVTIEIEVLASNPSVDFIENDGRIVAPDIDGNFMEFIIRNIEDSHDSSGLFKKIEGEGGEYELIDEWLTSYTQSSTTLSDALQAILEGTRWEIGEMDSFSKQESVSLKNVSVRRGITDLLNQWNAEVAYRVEVDGNRISRRFIDVYKARGRDTGKRFESGKDIISTNRVLDSTEIKTALYGLGSSDDEGNRLTFGDVEWKESNGDPIDKPLGQTWVGDDEAMAKWGYQGGRRHKFGSYDGQEEDPADLLINTWEELKKVNRLRETYEVDVIQLGEILGYPHEKVRLGDGVRVINHDIQPHLESRASIVEYKHNLNDYRLSECTIGHFRAKLDTDRRLGDIENDYNDKRGEWDKKPKAEADRVFGELHDFVDEEIERAEENIENAKKDLEEAIKDIEDTKVDLEKAEQIIEDSLENEHDYVGNFDGDIAADNLVIRESIIAASAQLTGELIGNNITFIEGTFEKIDVIDANIEDAVITGELDGVKGTFTGDLVGANIYADDTVFVGDELLVTNTLQLGENNRSGQINFAEGLSLLGRDHTLVVSADIMQMATGSVGVNFSVNNEDRREPYIEFYRNNSRMSRIFQDTVDGRLKLQTGNRDGNGASIWLDINGNIYFRYNGENKHIFYSEGSHDHGDDL